MFYVLSGRIYLEKLDCQVKKVLSELGPGQYFGEMALLIDITRTATAIAVEDSHVAVISADTLRDILRQSQGIALHMLQEFSRRLRNSNMALEELTNLWTRLAIILHFMDKPGAPIEDHLVRLTSITKKEAAEIREFLAELAREGILIIENDRVLDVVRERMWALFDSGDLKKCFIEERDKI